MNGHGSVRNGIVILATILIIIGATLLLTNRHHTEAGFQGNTLAAVQNTPDDQIKSVYLRWRWGKPEKEATLTSPKDFRDIAKLMEVIREDLWVDNKEIYPNGNEPPPAYDVMRIQKKSGKELPLYCWFGNMGDPDNPSLTMRSRKGDFKRVVREILKTKGKPMIKK